jgi:hypothetical protein
MSGRGPTAPARARGTGVLAELHTRLLDTIAGLDKIIELAEPEFARIAGDFRALHVRQSEAVSAMLSRDGHDPAQDGSIFGRVNRMAVAVRAWFDDISTHLMDELIEGEKHVLEGFDAVIDACDDEDRRRQLGDERAALLALLDRHANPPS